MFAARTSTWVTSAISLVILLVRLTISRRTAHPSKLGDALVVVSIFIIAARIPVICYVLRYGTAADALENKTLIHTDHDIKVGSILTLIARFLATTFYWTQTALLLIFYAHVLDQIDWCRKAIKIIWATIMLTYTATTLSTFLECRPFSHYWLVHPKPDECTRAYVQIFMQGILNIVLDLMLLGVSLPLWVGRHFSVSQMLRIAALLIVGTFCMIVTALKLGYVVGADSQQDARSFWASIQILVSAFVANVPTVYGTFNLMLRHKQDRRKRRASRPETMPTLSTIRAQPRYQPSKAPQSKNNR